MPISSRLYMFSFLFSILLFSMLYFVNTLYFTAILMFRVLFISIYSVYMGFISSLFSIMLIIIYVGAIIIFIGYICAISPNLLFSSSLSFTFFLFPLFFPYIFVYSYPIFNDNVHPVTDFLYSSSGVYLFILVAVVLFLILMVVSSQFFRPQGPFRSVG